MNVFSYLKVSRYLAIISLLNDETVLVLLFLFLLLFGLRLNENKKMNAKFQLKPLKDLCVFRIVDKSTNMRKLESAQGHLIASL